MNNKIQILFGVSGVREAYERTLKEKKLDIVCLAKEYAEVAGDYFDRDYFPRLLGSNIKTREVLPDIPANHEDAQKKDPKKNQLKFLTDVRKSESDFIVGEDIAVLVSYNKKEPYAVLINDPDLISNFQSQFNALWEGLR